MNTYKRHRFPPDIISYAVWLYYRFNLSHRDIEGLLAQRGITLILIAGTCSAGAGWIATKLTALLEEVYEYEISKRQDSHSTGRSL
jgi:hypothetical protein